MGPARNRLLLVPFGVVVGHVLGYQIAHPDSISRAASLGSVHGHMGAAWVVAAVGVVLAVAALAVEASRGTWRAPAVMTMFRWQATLFLVLEIVERLGDPNPAAAVVSERAVWVGLALQGLIALLSVRFLGVAEMVIGALVHRSATPRRSRQARVVTGAAPRVAFLRGQVLGRAPPAAA